MKNYTDTLKDFHHTFYYYEQLDDSSFEVEREALREFYDYNSNYFTDEEYDLYVEVECLSEVAEKYFDEIAAQEQLEQELDERKYAGSNNFR